MFRYNRSADRCKMSGACSHATDRRNDITACTVLQPPGGSPIFTPSTRPIFYKARETHNDKIQNKKRTTTKYSTKHTIQRKRQKLVDYRKNSFDDFRLMIVDTHPQLDSDEL